jgi:hypothetical protein
MIPHNLDCLKKKKPIEGKDSCGGGGGGGGL